MKIVFLLVISSLLSQAAIIIDNYAASTNDRYTNDTSFILNSYDLSGVGQTANGRWATLIGVNTIISANHFRPSGDVTFSSSNSTGEAFTRTIDSANTFRVSGTDLWVARLTEPVPTGTQIYSFDTTIPNSTSYLQDTNVFTTGLSPAANPSNFDQAFGTNLVTNVALQENPAGLGTADYIELLYDAPNRFGSSGPANPNYTTHESAFQIGDSGAPLFFDNGDGNLTLLGVNSFISSDSTTGEVFSSHVTHTGRQSTELNGFISQFESTIPEPSSTALLGLSFCCLLVRKNRK